MVNLTCIICPNGCNLTVDMIDNKWIVNGNMCPKGREFAINEMTNPKRSICSTVKTIYEEIPRLSVRTDGEVPKDKIFDIMNEINKVCLKKKVHNGDVIIEDILGTGVNIIATSDMYLWIMGE